MNGVTNLRVRIDAEFFGETGGPVEVEAIASFFDKAGSQYLAFEGPACMPSVQVIAVGSRFFMGWV